MIINIFSFTDKGRKLAERLSRGLDMHEARIVPKSAAREEICETAFRNREAIVFIGAAGIAVRSFTGLLSGEGGTWVFAALYALAFLALSALLRQRRLRR